MTDEYRGRTKTLIVGAAAIAKRVFGPKAKPRQAYHLADTTDFPIMKGVIGARLCAYDCDIDDWMEIHKNKRFLELTKRVRAEREEKDNNGGGNEHP